MAELKTHTTPQKLTIDYAPWATGVILVGLTLLFTAFGLYDFIGDQVSPIWWYASALCTAGAAALFITRERLTLDAASGQIDYRKRSVFGATHATAALTDIRDVELVEYHKGANMAGQGGGSRVTLRQISIRLPDKTVTIPDAFVGGPAVPIAHDAIQSWLNQPPA